MRTVRGVGAGRVPGKWWYRVGTLGVALVLPGGLLLLLYLMTRSRTHAAAPVTDPYVDWLRTRDGIRPAWQPTAPVAEPASTAAPSSGNASAAAEIEAVYRALDGGIHHARCGQRMVLQARSAEELHVSCLTCAASVRLPLRELPRIPVAM